jgi:predicted nucleic acid-binding protein
VDTGFLVALLDISERQHARCADLIANLEAPLITCEAVLAEACYLLRGLQGAAAALLLNVQRGNFVVPYRLTGNTEAIIKLIKKYADVPMDFADACLVDMANVYDTGRILTLDSDFRIYRWARNRAFELLLDI